ncbi:hypothetical protein Tsp_06796 [Trichinella spiralis]|uniref:hypothetical protein n=1 Tax=Trichinella spiralis TaxID=6334 RepID=UPI0001EFC5E5|nr:hypothetical protein Tsp_06796 [Trichinella spiralis]
MKRADAVLNHVCSLTINHHKVCQVACIPTGAAAYHHDVYAAHLENNLHNNAILRSNMKCVNKNVHQMLKKKEFIITSSPELLWSFICSGHRDKSCSDHFVLNVASVIASYSVHILSMAALHSRQANTIFFLMAL